MQAHIRAIAVNRRTKLAIALAGALIGGAMTVSTLYANPQPGCWNGKNLWYGDSRACFKDQGSTCVVC